MKEPLPAAAPAPAAAGASVVVSARAAGAAVGVVTSAAPDNAAAERPCDARQGSSVGNKRKGGGEGRGREVR